MLSGLWFEDPHCECWPPRQWIVRITSRAFSSTSAMMSMTAARRSRCRARMVTPGVWRDSGDGDTQASKCLRSQNGSSRVTPSETTTTVAVTFLCEATRHRRTTRAATAQPPGRATAHRAHPDTQMRYDRDAPGAPTANTCVLPSLRLVVCRRYMPALSVRHLRPTTTWLPLHALLRLQAPSVTNAAPRRCRRSETERICGAATTTKNSRSQPQAWKLGRVCAAEDFEVCCLVRAGR